MSVLSWRRMESVPGDTRVLTPGLSRFYGGSGETAVLLIHGFTGITGEMEYLAKRLFESGFTVSIPRLPGHGTNRRDFQSVTRHDWYRRCMDEYLELSARYSQVYAAGLSMGGLLTVLLAAQFAIPRIALAAPAFVTTIPGLRLTPLARFFLKKVRNPAANIEGEPDADRRYLGQEYRQWRSIGPAAELRKLQKLATARLPDVHADTLTIVSKKDKSVPLAAAELVEANISARDRRCIVLEESAHAVVNGVDRERVADEISAWFTR